MNFRIRRAFSACFSMARAGEKLTEVNFPFFWHILDKKPHTIKVENTRILGVLTGLLKSKWGIFTGISFGFHAE